MAKWSTSRFRPEDLDRAKNFYGSIFGWRLQTTPMEGGEYTTVMTTPVDQQTQMPTEPGAINGGLMQRTESTPSPVITIDVEAIDDALLSRLKPRAVPRSPRGPRSGHGGVRLLQGSGGQRAGLVGDHLLGQRWSPVEC